MREMSEMSAEAAIAIKPGRFHLSRHDGHNSLDFRWWSSIGAVTESRPRISAAALIGHTDGALGGGSGVVLLLQGDHPWPSSNSPIFTR